MLSCFPRGVLDEILNLIESVSMGFPSYSYTISNIHDTVQHASDVFLPFFFPIVNVISLHSHLRQHVHNVDKIRNNAIPYH